MLITVNCHSSIKIDDMFFDPYNIDDKNYNAYNTETGKIMSQKVTDKTAKFVFITHTHFDHLSIDDIKKVADEKTTFVIPKDAENEIIKNFSVNKVIVVKPNQTLKLDDMNIEVLPAYNKIKKFHPKENGWLGFKVTKNNTSFAVLGDTDLTPELEKLKVDILTLPIGSTFTMNYSEAAELTNIIKPKVAIPVHYGLLDGTGDKNTSRDFKNLVDNSIKVEILIQ